MSQTAQTAVAVIGITRLEKQTSPTTEAQVRPSPRTNPDACPLDGLVPVKKERYQTI
jgi:hypothetical protein